MTITITESIATKVLNAVDAGLVSGVGDPIPGQMCVEAAVCYALGLPHGDDPGCVDPALRALKIRLNDAPWSSPQARARGLRKLAVLQLGSLGAMDSAAFADSVAMYTVTKFLPPILRRAEVPESVVQACEFAKDLKAAAVAAVAAGAAARAAGAAARAAVWAAEAAAERAARAAARAAAWAAAVVPAVAADEILISFAEGISDILIQMQVPGVVWLPLLGE